MKVFYLFLFSIYVTNSEDWTYNQKWNDTCATGKTQSPINIVLSNIDNFTCLDTLQLQIIPNFGEAEAQNHLKDRNILTKGNFSTLKIKFPDKTTAIQYQNLQFHLHHRSQHHVNGYEHDVEIHFVHSTTDNSIQRTLAVVGFLFKQYDD